MAATERRLTPTERLHEVTMAYAQRTAAPPMQDASAKRGAKGIPEFEVTVRGHNLREVLDSLRAAYVELDTALPYPLEAPVSPPAEPQAAGDPLAGLPAGGRSRARGKAATA
jgi:hypothetical protein